LEEECDSGLTIHSVVVMEGERRENWIVLVCFVT